MKWTWLMVVFSPFLRISECTTSANLAYLERGDVNQFLVLPLTPNLTVNQFTVCFRFWENQIAYNSFLQLRVKDNLTMSSLSNAANSHKQPPAFIDATRVMDKMNESQHYFMVQGQCCKFPRVFGQIFQPYTKQTNLIPSLNPLRTSATFFSQFL
jgi:hypothetical protein